MEATLFMHAATPVVGPSMLDAPSDPNLEFLCVQQLEAAPFCENYAKLHFDVKRLEKGLNREWWNFWFLFSEKSEGIRNTVK